MKLTSGQNKVAAIVVIIVMVFLELVMLMVMISIPFSEEKEKWQMTFTFVFVMAIFSMPLRWAYLVLKRQKTKSASLPPGEAIDPSIIVKVQTKIELPEYRQLLFQLTYSSSVIIYLHIIAIGMLFFSLLNGTGEWYAYAFIIFILYLPVAVYRNANTNYKATKMIHETLSYEFSRESLLVAGETFNSTIQWNSFHKARELKKWFLLYTNKQVAMLIPKRSFTSLAEMDEFRKLIGGIEKFEA
jgi:hypothetical protein